MRGDLVQYVTAEYEFLELTKEQRLIGVAAQELETIISMMEIVLVRGDFEERDSAITRKWVTRAKKLTRKLRKLRCK